MKTTSNVVIYSAQLVDHPNGMVVLRGYVDLKCLANIHADDYQREILSGKKITSLGEALKDGKALPEIELGMRGGKYTDKNGVFTLTDPVYLVDGLQRVTAAQKVIEADKAFALKVSISAVVYFDTTKAWEKDRFEALNLGQSKLSPNVILRNKSDVSPSIAALLRLSEDKTFPLFKKVCWDHSMKKGQIISATTLCKVVGILHGHAGPGNNSGILEWIAGLDKIQQNVGKANFYFNAKTFFETLDAAFGLKRVAYRDSAGYTKLNFMCVLAQVLSDQQKILWKTDRLCVDHAFIGRLQKFPIDDPNVVAMASSGSQAQKLLYLLLIDHLNSGKRTRRLINRYASMAVEPAQDDEDEE